MFKIIENIINPKPKVPATEPVIPYATFGERTFASVVDMLLSLLVIAPVMNVFSQRIMREVDIQAIIAKAQYANSLSATYAILSEGGALRPILINNIVQFSVLAVIVLLFWFKKCATPGKMLLKMRIVDAVTLEKPTRRQLVIRLLAYIPSAVPFMFGFFWMSFDKKRQGWHDKIAGTVVLKDKRDWPWSRKKATAQP